MLQKNTFFEVGHNNLHSIHMYKIAIYIKFINDYDAKAGPPALVSGI